MDIESVHEKEMPNKCLICDFNCSQKGNSKVHTESVHEKTKKLNFSI